MKRQDELNEAWCKYMGKCSTEIMQALAFALRWADEHPHWISVADELPPRWEKYPHLSKNVLCSDGVNVMVNYYDYNEAEWTYGVGMSHITHWMPMPQPLVVSKMENTEKKGGEQ